MKKILVIIFTFTLITGLFSSCAAKDSAAPKAMSGAGTLFDPFLVSTAEQFQSINDSYESLSAHYRLVADITLEKHIPIGNGRNIIYKKFSNEIETSASFRGVFDGYGHIITIRTFDEDFIKQSTEISNTPPMAGVFGKCDVNSLIKNLTVKGEIKPVSMVAWVGGIAANSQAYIKNCSTDVLIDVSGNSMSVGGIAGHGLVENCYSLGDIKVSGGSELSRIGGIIGSGSADKCYASGNIYVEKGNAGGIVGEVILMCKVKNCAALNKSITGGSAAKLNRICGNYEKYEKNPNALENNYAYPQPNITSSKEVEYGKDFTISHDWISEDDFSRISFSFGVTEDSPWMFEKSKLYLPIFCWQNIDNFI